MYLSMSKYVTIGMFERGAGIFYIITTIVFTPPLTAISIYNAERGLLRRETNQHTYSLTAFFFSKSMTLLPMETAGALVVRTE